MLALARSKRPCEPSMLSSSVLLMPVAIVSAVLRAPAVPLTKL